MMLLFKNIKNYISNKSFNINYIFFSFFLVLITFFSSFKTNLLFTFYSMLQAFLLTTIFIFFYHYLKYKFLKNLFIVFIFYILLLYLANFVLLGLMNINLLFAVNIFLSGDLKNFLITLRALNINSTFLLIILLSIIIIPSIGIFSYGLTNKLCQKKTLKIKQKHLLIFFISAFIILICIDFICKHENINYISKNQNKLPLFFNYHSNFKQKIFLTNNLKPLRNEEKILKELNEKNINIDHKPNIFIFVVESLRKDYLTKGITPNIYSFKEKNITSDITFSSSNTSQISWYSIFHSNYPIYWAEANKTLKQGSIPLHILKKTGYKINLFTSTEISYFNMDKLLFGKKNFLVDNFKDFSRSSNEASQRDKFVIEALKKKISINTNKNSNVFIIFLDSTHSEYSWPKNFKPKFLPFANKINYLTLSQNKKDLELLKNRYKNALNYIDFLFNDFISALKKNNFYDDSIIVFTSDHGEEFFEKKSLFHASHLNDYQIKVPIIFKLLKNNEKCSKTISHINIFPTILAEILPNENFNTFFDGKSIFSNEATSYILSVNQKGNFTPNEFLFIKDQIKLHGKLMINNKKLSFNINKFKNINSENIEKETNIAFKDLIKLN